MDTWNPDARRAVVALVLLVPAPSVGVIAGLVVAPSTWGHAVFAACKLWILGFPAVWWWFVEGGRPRWSPPPQRGMTTGVIAGVAIAAGIIAVYFLALAPDIDAAPLRRAVDGMGLTTPARYLAAAAGWTLANSLIEEYVYRWFILRHCSRLLPRWPAIILSAGIFTVHHVFATATYLDPGLAALASAGVLAGGLIWAWLYTRHRSLWPCWISHILADVAVFGLGYLIVFG